MTGPCAVSENRPSGQVKTLLNRWFDGKSQKITPTRHENEANWEISGTLFFDVFSQMNPQPQAPKLAPMWRRILGSFLAALVGWISLMIYIQSTIKPNLDDRPYTIVVFVVAVGMIQYFASILIFCIWLVGFLPLYLLVPLRSPLWKWPICTICGAIGGAALMLIIGRALLSSNEPWADYVRPSIVAAGVGWITCLFASLTRRYFQYSTRKSE